MIKIEKEKPAKEELKLFSVEIVLRQGVKGRVQMGTKIKGHRAEMMAFLEATEVDPTEYKKIIKHAADATLQDFVQQVVNLSKSIESAEMELKPWSDSNANYR